MTNEDSNMAANAICFAADMAKNAIQEAAYGMMRPSVVWRPRIFIDGNAWCALYGENLQDGVAGFGDSPADAMYAFDKAWCAKLPPPPALTQEESNDDL
jgi:hypothetical protein